MSARDPFDALRDAWRELEPPGPDAPSMDAGERAMLAWLRAAWSELEAPPVALPAVLARRRAARLRRTAWRSAAALAGLALAIWFALQLGSPERAREGPEDVVQAEPAVPGAQHAIDAIDATDAIDAADSAGAAVRAARLEVASVEPGRMELRSGTVRLIWLDEWTEEPLDGASAR